MICMITCMIHTYEDESLIGNADRRWPDGKNLYHSRYVPSTVTNSIGYLYHFSFFRKLFLLDIMRLPKPTRRDVTRRKVGKLPIEKKKKIKIKEK